MVDETRAGVLSVMQQAPRRLPELAGLTGALTTSTGGRLERALILALRSRAHQSAARLNGAVGDASRELRAKGLNDHSVRAFFGHLVEEAGRACGADGHSLLSGQPRWMPVRTRVVALADAVLREPDPYMLQPLRV